MLREALVRPVSKRVAWLHALFGAVLPPVFLVVDPIVFRTNALTADGAGAYLGAYRAFGYMAVVEAFFLVIIALARPRRDAFLAGMLYGAAITAAVLGLVLLPVSAIGVVIWGIGLLGLSPFVASWIYARNAAREHATATGRLWSRAATRGLLTFFLIAVGAQVLVDQTVGWAVSADKSPAAARVLSLASYFYDADQLVPRFATASPAEQRQLVIAYHRMTGKSIDDAFARFID
jgi:hypothetical protein